MRKKWVSIALIIMLCLTVFNVVYGAQALSLLINGEEVPLGTAVKIENGQMYAPVRVVADYLKEDISWNSQTKTVTINPDVWQQDIQLGVEPWIFDRNTVIQFLMYFDEMNQEGKKLVSQDFQSNIVGSEVVIPLTHNSHMVDYKFVDAKIDQQAKLMTIRVKIWYYFDPSNFQVRTWDFTLDLEHFSDTRNMRHPIIKIWQVDTVKEDSYTVFPGLTFKTFK
ncbi:MAG: copper amine oxidase N-terminal domain-containing protein [Clostridia bacterium]